MRCLRFLSCLCVATISGVLWLAGTASAAETRGDCAALASMKINETNLLSSAVVAAKDELPEYCRVLGYIRPAINFEIRLPTRGWNGKFFMAGCGGLCGDLRAADGKGFFNTINVALRRSYAVVTMDGGHWGRDHWDARWAYQNPVQRSDLGERAVTATAGVTKEVIRGFYGDGPKKSYFAGCSTGGRQAHMEALRHPDDFDGIISGAPSLYDMARGWYAAVAWIINANTDPDGRPILTAAKIPMIQDAVYHACAGIGGLVDDPRACHFQPKDLQCHAGPASDCLTEAEVGVVEKWYGGAKTSTGERIYPGLPVGSEPYWIYNIVGKDRSEWEANKADIVSAMRWFGFPTDPGADYDLQNFNFDIDTKILQKAVDPGYVADGTDLSKFKARKGKILIYQGWADVLVAPEATRQWYEDLTRAMGGEAPTREFARLFLLPGFDHCGFVSSPGVGISGSSGPGSSYRSLDPLTLLEKWVEEGVAPESLLMIRNDKDGHREWARPACAYPAIARYKGAGDWRDPENWACKGS